MVDGDIIDAGESSEVFGTQLFVEYRTSGAFVDMRVCGNGYAQNIAFLSSAL